MAITFWDDAQGPDARGMLSEVFSGNPWDFVEIGDFKSPGLAEVVATPAMKFDEKSSAGRHGSSIHFAGYKPTKVEITIHIWTKLQLDEMEDFIAFVWPVVTGGKGGPQPKALTIKHPSLNALHVKSIAILGISTYLPSGKIQGGKMIRLTCAEYEPTNKKKDSTGKVKPPPLAAKFTQGENFTTADGKSVQVKGANAQPTAPSQSVADTGPQSQSLPAV